MLNRYVAGGTLAILGLSICLHAQDFKLGSRTVQVHGFASQGYGYSNQNNFLTMNTTHGSPAFTEGALNLSMPVTDKFRIGGQGYSRKIGSLDDFRPQLDWAYGDYKFASWFGLRAGKVKTVMGLYNDTQDMTFLYTWALLPQGLYPVDLRTTYIAHTGGDAYGHVSLKKAGKLEYTIYAGVRSFDNREGFYYYTAGGGFPIKTIKGRMIGADLKWFPVKGMTLGVSEADLTAHRTGFLGTTPYTFDSTPNRPLAGYADYARGKWEGSFEYRYVNNYEDISFGGGTPIHEDKCTTDWFASASYRITPKLQAGYYHSSTRVEAPTVPTDLASNHIYDEVVAGRYDVNSHWDVKAEGHFMDGYGDSRQTQGFYSQWNPKGLKPTTNFLMLRATFKF